jgi:septum formation protein
MLFGLSGRTHEVVTGFAVVAGSRIVSGAETTRVQFRELAAGDIDWYVGTGEPLDKAGAYGIQERGALWVEAISGDYFTVVGLPIARVHAAICELGYTLR